MKFLQKNIFPIIIIFLVLIICILNYEPGTWLSGWDTLHPEFNFALSLKRVFFGAWQEHQGLGATASQAHAAEIPRILFLGLFSLILPLSFLRYFYFFLCLFLGPLGIYFFLKKRLAGFLAALFYLFNLGTIQHFYVPLEMFATQFVALPWLFLTATNFLKSKKQLGWFILVSFLTSPMAHTATLFYVYFLSLIIYLITFCPLKRKKVFFKRSLIIIVLTLVVNSFWLLPNLYYVLAHGHEVKNSKIHRLFTPEAISQSRQYSNLKDVFLIKGFLFNWRDFKETGRFDNLLRPWQIHLKKPMVLGLGYSFFAVAMLGLVVGLFKRKKLLICLLPVFGLAFFFMLILHPFFELVYFWLISSLPLFGEILRFPFTKFSLIFMFCSAVFFGQAMSFLLTKKRLVSILLSVLIMTAFIYYMKPVFSGFLINPNMRVKIPDKYFQMFSWLNDQESGRILKLPIHTLWGWNYYEWGYQGAGFLWFGLDQPLLDREFDRWSPYNEEAYREFSYAIYSQNLEFFQSLLEKYQIRWLVLDESIIAPNEPESILFNDEIKKMLVQAEGIKPIKDFGEKLKVYQVNLKGDQEIFALTQTENLSAEKQQKIFEQMPQKINFDFEDQLEEVTNYKLDLSQFNLLPENCGAEVSNQFLGLKMTEDNQGLILSAKNAIACVKIPLSIKDASLMKIDFQTSSDIKPSVCLFDNRLGRCAGQRFNDPFFELIGEADNYQLQFSLESENLDLKEALIQNIELSFFENSLEKMALEAEGAFFAKSDKPMEYFSQFGSISDTFYYPQLSHNQGYALIFDSKNISGLPLRICLTNYQTKHCDLDFGLHNSQEFKKEIFLLPPMSEGRGYDVNLKNYSVSQSPSINHLKSVQLFPIEYQWFETLEKQENVINNNQSFDRGWLAVDWQSGWPRVLPHIMVNNWANGWQLDNEGQKPLIFFWPQILEYLGLAVLVGVGLFIWSNKSPR